MAGELTPAVFFPRFTTVSGIAATGDPFFATVAMDATPFQSGLINVWRGKINGASPSVKFNFQESSDGVKWFNCSGYTADADPGDGVEAQYAPVIRRKWFRVTVELGNAANYMTFWAAGFLEERET
jgi:hypothetical protein